MLIILFKTWSHHVVQTACEFRVSPASASLVLLLHRCCSVPGFSAHGFPLLGRLKAFKAALLDVFREAHAQSVGMSHLTESINRDREEPFSSEEIQASLSRMQDDNQVMVSEGIIFLI